MSVFARLAKHTLIIRHVQCSVLGNHIARKSSTVPEYKVEHVVKRSCVFIGKGPHWDERTRTLLYVDIHDGVVHRWSEDTGKEDTHTFGTFCSLIVPRRKGGYIVSLYKTICHFDWESKAVMEIATVDEHKKTRLNDGKCDASGRLWFGSMELQASPTALEPNQGSLFSLETDSTIRVRKEGVNISNGLAWSTDNKTMYYIDSVSRKVYAYNFDLNSGNISNERVCVDFGEEETMASLGYPDGMAIDTDGMLWVACYSAGKVVRFDPKSGMEIGSVSIPARRTTSCCFGGKKFDEMFVTCSRYGLTKDEEKTTLLAGSLFRVTGLGVRGLPAPIYEG